jgi:hypothetical protein
MSMKEGFCNRPKDEKEGGETLKTLRRLSTLDDLALGSLLFILFQYKEAIQPFLWFYC